MFQVQDLCIVALPPCGYVVILSYQGLSLKVTEPKYLTQRPAGTWELLWCGSLCGFSRWHIKGTANTGEVCISSESTGGCPKEGVGCERQNMNRKGHPGTSHSWGWQRGARCHQSQDLLARALPAGGLLLRTRGGDISTGSRWWVHHRKQGWGQKFLSPSSLPSVPPLGRGGWILHKLETQIPEQRGKWLVYTAVIGAIILIPRTGQKATSDVMTFLFACSLLPRRRRWFKFSLLCSPYCQLVLPLVSFYTGAVVRAFVPESPGHSGPAAPASQGLS